MSSQQQSTGDCLQHATTLLVNAGIATARLDSLVLLEDITNIDRAQLLAHPEQMLTASQAKKFTKMVQQRSTHEPLAYIRGKTEFYGREFHIDHHVLEPRPESEGMIDILKLFKSTRTIIDVGTGSGALAITAKLEIPQSQVIAIDIDTDCLAVAKQNAKQLGADIAFISSDLLENIDMSLLDSATLLCNLPYVPDSFQINPAAMREPRLAIFGGPDGLDLYRKLFQQLKDAGSRPLLVLTESMPPQHAELKSIAEAAGFVLDRSEDFIQSFRISSGSSAL